MLGTVSGTVYLSRSFNNTAFPPTEIVRRLKSACLVDYTDFSLRLPSPLSYSVFICSFCFSFSHPRPYASFLVSHDVFLYLSTFASRFHAPTTVYSYSHRTSSPVMFHFDFPKFPARCQMVVDWIGLFTVVHLFPSKTSFGSFPRKIRWYFLISASRSRLGPTAGDVSHTKRKTGNIHIYLCVCVCFFFKK